MECTCSHLFIADVCIFSDYGYMDPGYGRGGMRGRPRGRGMVRRLVSHIICSLPSDLGQICSAESAIEYSTFLSTARTDAIHQVISCLESW